MSTEGFERDWPELDEAIACTLDTKEESFALLRRYMQGEFEGGYDADEMRDDMIELLDLLEQQFGFMVGSVYTIAREYDKIRTGFKVLAEMPPDRLAAIQKAAGITPQSR